MSGTQIPEAVFWQHSVTVRLLAGEWAGNVLSYRTTLVSLSCSQVKCGHVAEQELLVNVVRKTRGEMADSPSALPPSLPPSSCFLLRMWLGRKAGAPAAILNHEGITKIEAVSLRGLGKNKRAWSLANHGAATPALDC